MGKKNRARGADRARRRRQTCADEAAVAWLDAAARPGGRATGLRRLAQLPPSAALAAADRLAHTLATHLWHHGWQPRELYRQARVQARGTTTRLVEVAVVADLDRVLAGDAELHPDWAAQAAQVVEADPDATAGWLGHRPPTSEYPAIAEALGVLGRLPPLEVLVPPPGTLVVPGRATSAADPVLDRVRHLLAKAESTEFEPEAVALTEKAQELITRHALDRALLHADAHDVAGEPTLVRIAVDPPYADAKGLLLQRVAAASRCRAFSLTGLALEAVVGNAHDLRAVELLFTSLLVQAQHALAEAGRAAPPGSHPRGQAFRSTFLLAYARRIGERLAAVNEHVLGTHPSDRSALLPALRADQDKVDAFLHERFGTLTNFPVRGGGSAAGWASGTIAADLAHLTAGDLGSRSAPA
ncbi:DUF2786 domain-containing protein [Nocardioides aquiterrae]|uniref:DUF2786 domain-containing protein n=1 Tax=Nocardioides aquiterrae TaxID=203799 RepID=A0ABN1USF1_9ACTN